MMFCYILEHTQGKVSLALSSKFYNSRYCFALQLVGQVVVVEQDGDWESAIVYLFQKYS